jgi:dTDP-glucose pyrophosphorylase/predicted transcriptional regulator
MSTNHTKIQISPDSSIREAIEIIEVASFQIALVVKEDGLLLGTVTDGDIRRGILKGLDLNDPVVDVMNRQPTTARIGTPRDELLALMTAKLIKQVPLVDANGLIVGLELLDSLLQNPVKRENPVVILAGGLGKRLRPLTADTPKPLLKVGGQPLLELIISQFQAHGFRDVYISVNHLGNLIEEYFGDGQKFGISISYLRESEPLGTAGPLSLMPKSSTLPCVVVNGDVLTKVSFEHMLQFHNEGGFDLTIGIKEYPLNLPFGVVVTEGDRVLEFREKPVETRLINAGVYVIAPIVLEMLPEHTYYDMNQLIDRLLSKPDRNVGAFLIHEYWMDIGTAADYQQAQWDYSDHFSK